MEKLYKWMGVRVDSYIDDNLAKLIKETGLTKSHHIRKALELYFGQIGVLHTKAPIKNVNTKDQKGWRANPLTLKGSISHTESERKAQKARLEKYAKEIYGEID